ncbi:MAG: hypothetical protein IPH94_13670 [Saprospiraceae bacterium]|nr:hypothetical protein [Saprospiraceae bacterium]
MLKIGINTLFIIFLAISGCNTNRSASLAKFKEHDIYIKYKFKSYRNIYNMVRDSFIAWKSDSLEISGRYFFDDRWILDSCIVFNSDSTVLQTNLIMQGGVFKNSMFDYLDNVIGFKVNNRWYLFYGVSTVLNRINYQDSMYSPLSFDELSYLSRSELRMWYFIADDGKILPNNRAFDSILNPKGFGLTKNCTVHQLDSAIIARSYAYSKGKMDLSEIESINKEISTSVRPPEPYLKKSLWEKLFGEKKLFESKEWKEYLRKKYGRIQE